ncbi:hypothetical protein RFI_06631 [Reticulomyxa filosa]|uniref:Uncharacterized protein n=1 Tax=Reticulomyxa filosa TaxID=46433 RepID=X6NW11_RETFI|nr:hypothetical protein RFI_06631 [Reticulomyxa filosa]|eukprot:ETO30485.1 hypothetical protein RFI_06631 [Reticulomyxa filosa]
MFYKLIIYTYIYVCIYLHLIFFFKKTFAAKKKKKKNKKKKSEHVLLCVYTWWCTYVYSFVFCQMVHWKFGVKSDIDYVAVRSGDVNGAMCIAVSPWKCYHLTIKFSPNSSGIAEWKYQGLTLGYWNVPTYPPEYYANPRRLWQSHVHHTSDDKDFTDEETDDDNDNGISIDSSNADDSSSSDESFARHWSTAAGETFEVCIP